MMRFGVCTKPEQLQAVIDAGYDYIELSLMWLAAMEEEAYLQFRKMLEASPVKAETTNCFFPREILLVGPEADHKRVENYTKQALARAADLGIRICVMGSGAARNIPEGFDPKEAEEQLIQVLRQTGDIAQTYGITIALEPLREKETNLINTVAQGLALCRKVNHPAVKCLADFYHVLCSEESMDAIENAGEMLVHTHLACYDRAIPSNEADVALCETWAAALKKCGYEGRISLEGRFGDDFAGAIKTALPILKKVFNKGE
ncbi:MAG: sugar phosphate isomerase/epimerase [Clostridia bacterium]|nr:sugar phosphate isomerase/epimerase [Clostridia bacterium]